MIRIMRIYKVGVFSTQFVCYCFLLFCWFFFFFNFFFDIQFSSEVSVVSFFLRNVLLVIRLVHFFFGAFSISLCGGRVCARLVHVYSLLLIFNPIPLPVPIIVWHTRPIVHYAYVNWFWSDADIVINNRWHTCIVYVLQCTAHSTMYMRFCIALEFG